MALFVPLLAISSSIALLWASSSGAHSIWNAYVLFFVTLLGSITLYRISPFHPLARYPGPVLCKVSKLWTAFASYQGELQEYHQQLHEKYGPIVRVGPNELSVTNKEFIPLVLGSSGLPKGPLWEGRIITPPNDKTKNYILTRPPDLQGHARLRKSWNKAFGTGPLNDYADLLISKASQLNEHFMGLCTSSPENDAHIDFAKWMSFFSLDFMGDMAFGGGFDFMGDGDKDGLWRGLESALVAGSITQHVPWLSRILLAISFTEDSSKNFRLFALKQAKLRSVKEVQKKDLFYHLVSLFRTYPFLSVSESVLTILAGSDTTATVLRNIMYYLLAYPDYFQAVRKEIDKTFSFEEQGSIELAKLPSMKLLNAIINETLRMLPALSTSIQRAPPKDSGGKRLGNIFIPEGTGITIPPYCLHRDPRYFSPRADEFWPDRWLMGKKTDDKDFILDLAAFIPFSYGPANCVGKSLAMLELRYITAMLLRQFDISFQPGFKVAMQEKGLGDRFILSGGPLPVVITPRASG
ncbi:high nitrogen upregulated cytochrome P450 monooxygenase 2 [Flammula alnicola]|nr:high nitrogen upregulated cytochrome P450 monooxygenase 2 [Flammula alnicola]